VELDEVVAAERADALGAARRGAAGAVGRVPQGAGELARGPVGRRGAFLLDLSDPTKVIGRLREPLIKPDATEREGYVPNVVYSCGSLLDKGQLIIPYAMSDYATTFATLPLDEVLAAME